MKNLKRALSLIVAIASVSTFMPSALAASYSGGGAMGGSSSKPNPISLLGEEVLYFNNFPTGTNADLPEVEHEKYYFYGRNEKLKYAINAGMEYIFNAITGTVVCIFALMIAIYMCVRSTKILKKKYR